MKITLHGRANPKGEVPERRTASTQRNVHALKIEIEEAEERPQNQRIEIIHNGISYRVELEGDGLVISVAGAPAVTDLIVRPRSTNAIYVEGARSWVGKRPSSAVGESLLALARRENAMV